VGRRFRRPNLTAFEHYQNGTRPTRSWLLAFTAAQRWWPLVLQHLLLGMNAHINLDLGIAMARSVLPEELPAARDDFNRINDVLAGLIDQVQDELTQLWPWHGFFDWIGGRHDEVLINFSLEKARDQAWRVAEHLAALSPAEQEHAISILDTNTEGIGRFVLHPGLLASAALALVRVGERGAVPDIIDILL
jgi:hypothetical protein